MSKLMFQTGSILITQKSVCFVITGIIQIKILLIGRIMQKSIDLKNIAIVHIKKSAYRIYFLNMTNREAKKLMANSYLTDKKGVL